MNEFSKERLIDSYDEMVPHEYKQKNFSRLSKSHVRSQPNHLGLEHMKEHKERMMMREDMGDYL